MKNTLIVMYWLMVNGSSLQSRERTGVEQETYSGMNARIIQHEYDLLQGICCMDKARDIHVKEPEIAS